MSTTEVYFDNRAEWLEGRRTLGIGSSDAPAILGVSRYKSAYQLFQEKLGVMPASKNENELIQWGNILEEPIAQRYALETGRNVFNPNLTPGGQKTFTILRSRTIDFQIAQVDRFVEPEPPEAGGTRVAVDRGVLEIKNSHFFVGKSWLDEQEPPLEFIVQVQHQLAVTGATWGSIAALIGGCRFVWTDIARDDDFIELLYKAEAEFWERLRQNNPPPVDGSEWTSRALAKMYGAETSGQVLTFPPEAVEWHNALQEAKAAEKKASEARRAAENQFKAAIGTNAGGRVPGSDAIYTWKTQSRKVFTTKAASFRVLRVVEPRRAALPAGTVAPLQIEDTMETE